MLFEDLQLNADILAALTAANYTKPTLIQEKAIPVVMSGANILASAQTGTGKTAAFVLPILHKLMDKTIKGPSEGRPPIRALIIVPTRELALQVEESITMCGTNSKLKSMVMIGGVSMEPQLKKLRSNVDILVATPGRLLDHVSSGNVDLSKVQMFVLDEADRMLNMGFIKDIKRIIKLIPSNTQNLLFSATFSPEIKSLAGELLKNPVEINVAPNNTAAHTVTHKIHPVDKESKKDLLLHIIKSNNLNKVLIFHSTKHGANKLTDFLNNSGINSLAIHGNKSQNARVKALSEFKEGDLRCLVATDVAARGIDVVGLENVINFELPKSAEDYVHRIGRTGRNGSLGQALSLVTKDEYPRQSAIEKLMGQKLTTEVVLGFAPQGKITDVRQNNEVRSEAGANRSTNSARKDTRPVRGIAKPTIKTETMDKPRVNKSLTGTKAAKDKAKVTREEDRKKSFFFPARNKNK